MVCTECGHRFQSGSKKNCPQCGSFYIERTRNKKFSKKPPRKDKWQDYE